MLNHELLMNMLREDIKDKRLIKLIKKYLKNGVMENGIVKVFMQGWLNYYSRKWVCL